MSRVVRAIGSRTGIGLEGAPATFADVLREAIERRGLGLERIRLRLEARGVRLTAATLSYWQSGRSQPERRSSLAALPHLEEILDLAPGSLRAALTVPRERGRRSCVLDLAVLLTSSPGLGPVSRLDTRWETELERICMHDVLTVGQDRAPALLRVRQVLRARCDGPDRRVIMHALDDPDAAPPLIRSVRGCRIGRTAREPTGAIAAELLFFQPLRRGETVVVEYEITMSPSPVLDASFERMLQAPTREYLLHVQFDPECQPSACEQFRGDEDVRPLLLDPGHSVHLVQTNCAPGVVGIRWSWPAEGAEVNC